MRVRSAQTLIFSRHGGSIVAFNFLTKAVFQCSHDLLTFLTFLDEWTDLSDIGRFVPLTREEDLRSIVQHLVEANALTAEGSSLAEAEDDFRASWKWGIPAAAFHFSVQDKQYMSLDQAEALQMAKLAEGTPPALYEKNDLGDCTTRQLPAALDRNELLQLMARRRTIRSPASVEISLKQLADCLFAGLGITGATSNCVGSLPLSMTPSGGARNPYEAYVYARSVESLEPGFYHYSAFDHTLARVDAEGSPKPSELIGNEEWADQMPCVIILCALLERTMWKYGDANAYRVVLIEAGHIGQNVMLAATQHGLSACPSAALRHSEIRKYLGAKSPSTHCPVYALALTKPATSIDRA